MVNSWRFGKESLQYGLIKSLKEWSNEMEIVAIFCDFFQFLWKKYNDGRIVLEDKIFQNEKISNTQFYYGKCNWIGNDYAGHYEAYTVQEMYQKLINMIKNIECKFLDYILYLQKQN